jgi:hypothetical protein
LRHDGAIEGGNAALSRGGDKPAEYHWVSLRLEPVGRVITPIIGNAGTLQPMQE